MFGTRASCDAKGNVGLIFGETAVLFKPVRRLVILPWEKAKPVSLNNFGLSACEARRKKFRPGVSVLVEAMPGTRLLVNRPPGSWVGMLSFMKRKAKARFSLKL